MQKMKKDIIGNLNKPSFVLMGYNKNFRKMKLWIKNLRLYVLVLQNLKMKTKTILSGKKSHEVKFFE